MNQNSDQIDTRFLSREFLTTFVKIYKEHTALWKIKSAEYSNKNLKLKGYAALIEYCQTVYPAANKDFVTKKIQNMRGTFRKELKKINDHRKRGEPYEPRLWYFDLLLFTKDQETNGGDGAENLNGDENSEEEIVNTLKRESGDENLTGDSEVNVAPPALKYITMRKHRRKTHVPIKTRRKRMSEHHRELLKMFVAALNQKEVADEFEAVSVNVAAKLKKMESTQQILAEGLINKVLRMGLFNELSRTTDVTDYTSTSY